MQSFSDVCHFITAATWPRIHFLVALRMSRSRFRHRLAGNRPPTGFVSDAPGGSSDGEKDTRVAENDDDDGDDDDDDAAADAVETAVVKVWPGQVAPRVHNAVLSEEEKC